jgi:peptidoglycan hydrolase-like protein with peptidoglycan-binding domain
MVESTTAVPETPDKVEPAQTVATETIPPTAAAPEAAPKQLPAAQAKGDRSKDIQRALHTAGFYDGPIDGKIGPKTKKAIEAFQKKKGLIADGKVGPKTWAELERYIKE